MSGPAGEFASVLARGRVRRGDRCGGVADDGGDGHGAPEAGDDAEECGAGKFFLSCLVPFFLFFSFLSKPALMRGSLIVPLRCL